MYCNIKQTDEFQHRKPDRRRQKNWQEVVCSASGRSRELISRTEQYDRSLERALCPYSECQLVKLQWLAQPLLFSLCLSFCLIYYPDRPSGHLFQSLLSCRSSPLQLHYSFILSTPTCLPPPLSVFSHCVFASTIFWPPSVSHSSSVVTLIWMRSREMLENARNCKLTSPPGKLETHKHRHTHRLITVIGKC